MGQFGQLLDILPKNLKKTSQIIAHFNPSSEGFQNLKTKFEIKNLLRQKILPKLGKKIEILRQRKIAHRNFLLKPRIIYPE